MISLLTFIKTGLFGVLQIGDSRQRVEEVLGAPPDWMASHPASISPLWKYGDIEFHFDENRLWMIFADEFPTLVGSGFELDPWVLKGNARVEDVVQAFKREKISFVRRSFEFCERGIELETDSRVFLRFCGRRERKPRLISFCRR